MTEESQEATAADFDSCEQALATIAGFETEAGELDKVRLTQIEIWGHVRPRRCSTGTDPNLFASRGPTASGGSPPRGRRGRPEG